MPSHTLKDLGMIQRIILKYSLIGHFFDLYRIKLGETYKIENIKKCYRAQAWFRWLYSFYVYYAVYIFLFFIYAYFQDMYKNLYFSIPLTIFIHLIVEVIMVMFTPIEEIPCSRTIESPK